MRVVETYLRSIRTVTSEQTRAGRDPRGLRLDYNAIAVPVRPIGTFILPRDALLGQAHADMVTYSY